MDCKHFLNLKSLLLSLLLLCPVFVSGQKKPDHEVLLKEMENSSDLKYKECIGRYDDYLKKFPDDIAVLIEKCKFIESAQYNDEEEYNPNQEDLDSCIAYLERKFPQNPEVLLFLTTIKWGDDLDEIFTRAESALKDNPGTWSEADQGALYSKIAEKYYDDEKFDSAYTCIQKSILHDEKNKSSLLYVRILIEKKKNDEALKALAENSDSTKNTWDLKQKADLYFKLKAYTEALEIYKKIEKIDSTSNDNFDLASTLEAAGEYNLARKYLIADTIKKWSKKTSLKNLLIHDLKYQDGSTCIGTYNKFRDLGFSTDPLGLFRIKLFLSHPLQIWRFRDLPGLLLTLFILIILILIPYIWILPVHFAGHYWKFLDKPKPFDPIWGLKAFWFVSAGYLLSTFFASSALPQYFYSLVRSSYESELTQENRGLIIVLFIVFFSLFGLASLNRVKLGILLSKKWSVLKSVFTGIGILFAFKFVTGIYILIGSKGLGLSINDLATLPDTVFSSRQDITAVISTYGNGAAYALFCLLVPLYEEVIFRGVILGSCQRYLNFNLANLIQAGIFSFCHMNLFLAPVFFLFGIVTGIMRKRADGLLPGITFHVLNNSMAVMVLIVKSSLSA
jgi:uncharacterized protein